LIRWKLSEVMARHRVKGKDLADFLGISTNAVSTLKNAEIMPAIGGERWEQICDGINKLSLSAESITPLDLIEYLPQEVASASREPKHSLTADVNSNRSKDLDASHEATPTVSTRGKRKKTA
jgi:putative transcriptional regulator